MNWKELILETWGIEETWLYKLRDTVTETGKMNEILAKEWHCQPRQTSADIAAFYKDNFLYSTQLVHWHLLNCEVSLDNFAPLEIDFIDAGKHFLDFGTGMGGSGFQAQKAGCVVHMMDIDAPHSRVLEKAAFLINNPTFNFSYINYPDFWCEPPMGYYDIIYCKQTMEHLKAPLQYVKLFYDSLFPGGILIMENFFNDCEGKAPYHLRENNKFGNYEYWKKCVEMIGFQEVQENIWMANYEKTNGTR